VAASAGLPGVPEGSRDPHAPQLAGELTKAAALDAIEALTTGVNR
jgi:hypothetical protein